MIKIFLRIVLSISLLTAIQADDLDSFEQSFSKEKTKSESEKPISYTFDGWDSDQSFTEKLVELFAEIIVMGLSAGGMYAEQVADQRDDGDPVLPVFQVNAGYQWIDEGLSAIDYSLAAGHGLLAAGFRHTMFTEEESDGSEDLHFMQAHLFYRMALHIRAEWALGFGAAWLKGDKSETGFSFASPLRVWPLDWLGFELRPTWAFLNQKTLSDIETSLLLRYKQISLQAGYRWIEAEDSKASLSGWRAGFSWRF